MSNLLTNAFEIVTIARRHRITFDDAVGPAIAADLVLQQLKERLRLARGDIKTLESLVYDLVGHAGFNSTDPQPSNGSITEHTS